jgi:hypothetical protein
VSRKTGAKIMDGCKKMEYFVQSYIVMRYDSEEEKFYATFRKCTTNSRMVGKEVEVLGDGQGFVSLALEVCPEIDPERWEDVT